MKTATFRFQCRRCYARFNGASTSENNAQLITMHLTIGNPLPDLLGSAMVPKMVEPHTCKDGGGGVADFIGFDLD